MIILKVGEGGGGRGEGGEVTLLFSTYVLDPLRLPVWRYSKGQEPQVACEN